MKTNIILLILLVCSFTYPATAITDSNGTAIFIDLEPTSISDSNLLQAVRLSNDTDTTERLLYTPNSSPKRVAVGIHNKRGVGLVNIVNIEFSTAEQAHNFYLTTNLKEVSLIFNRSGTYSNNSEQNSIRDIYEFYSSNSVYISSNGHIKPLETHKISCVYITNKKTHTDSVSNLVSDFPFTKSETDSSCYPILNSKITKGKVVEVNLYNMGDTFSESDTNTFKIVRFNFEHVVSARAFQQALESNEIHYIYVYLDDTNASMNADNITDYQRFQNYGFPAKLGTPDLLLSARDRFEFFTETRDVRVASVSEAYIPEGESEEHLVLYKIGSFLAPMINKNDDLIPWLTKKRLVFDPDYLVNNP